MLINNCIVFIASAMFAISSANPVPDTSILQASMPIGSGAGLGGSSFGGGAPIGSGAGMSESFGNGGAPIGSGAGFGGSDSSFGGSGIGGGSIGSGAGFGSGSSGSCAWSHCENGICSSRGCTMTPDLTICAINHFSACIASCPFECFGPQLSACLRSCKSGCYCYNGYIFDPNQNVCIRIEDCSS